MHVSTHEARIRPSKKCVHLETENFEFEKYFNFIYEKTCYSQRKSFNSIYYFDIKSAPMLIAFPQIFLKLRGGAVASVAPLDPFLCAAPKSVPTLAMP